MAEQTIMDPLSRINMFKKTLSFKIKKETSNLKVKQTSNRLWIRSHSWEIFSLLKIRLTSSSRQTWLSLILSLKANNFHQLYYQNITLIGHGLSMNNMGRSIRSKTSRTVLLSPQTLRFNPTKVMRASSEIILRERAHQDLVLQTWQTREY